MKKLIIWLMVYKSFLTQIHKPTRITLTSATLVDHIYTNDVLAQSNSDIIINDVADHFGTFIIQTNKQNFYYFWRLQHRFAKI